MHSCPYHAGVNISHCGRLEATIEIKYNAVRPDTILVTVYYTDGTTVEAVRNAFNAADGSIMTEAYLLHVPMNAVHIRHERINTSRILERTKFK